MDPNDLALAYFDAMCDSMYFLLPRRDSRGLSLSIGGRGLSPDECATIWGVLAQAGYIRRRHRGFAEMNEEGLQPRDIAEGWWFELGPAGRQRCQRMGVPLYSENETPLTPTLGSYRGCLLGGAAGDALGGAVEFLSMADIQRRFGPQGIAEYAIAHGGCGRITDDTQMTLFTAEGLLRGWVRGLHKGVTDYPSAVSNAYLRWLVTQRRTNHTIPDPIGSEPGWLFEQQALHAQRAPGVTCLGALESMTRLGEPVANDSKGCGGVMRMAPVGLFLARSPRPVDLQHVFTLGRDLAALTHGHPSGQLPAGFLAALIFLLVRGEPLVSGIERCLHQLRRFEFHEETARVIEQVLDLWERGVGPEQGIPQLGEGWVGEEALAIALYCALSARDFEHAITMAVNHGGDSDSTGSLVGNIVGAWKGLEAIPARWLSQLELWDVVDDIAQDLYCYPAWTNGDDTVWNKYPGF